MTILSVIVCVCYVLCLVIYAVRMCVCYASRPHPSAQDQLVATAAVSDLLNKRRALKISGQVSAPRSPYPSDEGAPPPLVLVWVLCVVYVVCVFLCLFVWCVCSVYLCM